MSCILILTFNDMEDLNYEKYASFCSVPYRVQNPTGKFHRNLPIENWHMEPHRVSLELHRNSLYSSMKLHGTSMELLIISMELHVENSYGAP
jgi:hypothetical protein